MRIEMVAIWDAKAKAYMQPFFMLNVPLAVRSFTNAANKADSQIGVNPEDYTLFHVATFDDNTGAIEAKVPPEVVVSALQVLGKA